ncbi:MAG: alkaline phosphatase family protein [Alphaproteobacteria bacterium]|nr:alkaline phosphatase family protein [Alphaproteobacteria bacterium]
MMLVLPPGESPPPCMVEGSGAITPILLDGWSGGAAWAYDIALPLAAVERSVDYALGARRFCLTLPARAAGLRVAYAACNGSSDEGPGAPIQVHRNALWRQMAAEHARRPFHLLLLGGDQLYADAVWQSVPALVAWARKPAAARRTARLDAADGAAIRAFYRARYAWLWRQRDIAAMVAAVPTVMMWDDHDIFDGWGSHPPELQDGAVHQAIWAAAREAFALFQRGLSPQALAPGAAFGWSGRIGPVGIVVPDLRTERRHDRVLGPRGWGHLATSLDAVRGARHVLVASSVPVAHVDLSWLERLLGALPVVTAFLDDLRDQWLSPAHAQEWQRLIALLSGHAAAAPLTVVSGEIHLGALGRIETAGVEIAQLTASGIAHAAPPRLYALALELLARRKLDRGEARVAMLPLPGIGRRFLRARNWLALDVAADGGLDAAWHHDGAGPSPVLWRDARRCGAPRVSAAPA